MLRAGAPGIPRRAMHALKHGREVLHLLQAVSSSFLPGVEGFGIVFIQLVGAGIDDFVFRQTILSSAGRHPLLQSIIAGLWGLQCSLPLVTPSSGTMLSCVCQADICWTLHLQLQLEALMHSPQCQAPCVHPAGRFGSSSICLTVQASVQTFWGRHRAADGKL